VGFRPRRDGGEGVANMVLQKGHAVATVPAPVAASSRARTWETRASPFSSPRKASPPPAPQQKLRSWLRGLRPGWLAAR